MKKTANDENREKLVKALEKIRLKEARSLAYFLVEFDGLRIFIFKMRNSPSDGQDIFEATLVDKKDENDYFYLYIGHVRDDPVETADSIMKKLRALKKQERKLKKGGFFPMFEEWSGEKFKRYRTASFKYRDGHDYHLMAVRCRSNDTETENTAAANAVELWLMRDRRPYSCEEELSEFLYHGGGEDIFKVTKEYFGIGSKSKDIEIKPFDLFPLMSMSFKASIVEEP